jgi:hypothetical protein
MVYDDNDALSALTQAFGKGEYLAVYDGATGVWRVDSKLSTHLDEIVSFLRDCSFSIYSQTSQYKVDRRVHSFLGNTFQELVSALDVSKNKYVMALVCEKDDGDLRGLLYVTPGAIAMGITAGANDPDDNADEIFTQLKNICSKYGLHLAGGQVQGVYQMFSAGHPFSFANVREFILDMEAISREFPLYWSNCLV